LPAELTGFVGRADEQLGISTRVQLATWLRSG